MSDEGSPTEQRVLTAAASEEQRRLLLLEQLAGDAALYNVHFAFRWHGEVAADLLEAALAGVVARHEVLRTTFRSLDGEPQQIIAESRAVPLTRTARDDVPKERREQEALRLASAHARAPFDLAEGPLLRAELVSFSPLDHAFLLTLHHTVFDGWSAGVLFDELTELYAAGAEGRAARLEPLPLQYADFGDWQRDSLESGAWDAQLDHWALRLGDVPDTAELPADRPRPARRGHRGQLVELALPAAVERQVDAVCRGHRATRFSVLFAAFAVLLHRFTGSRDLVVGTVDAGRSRPELEPLIGLFTQTLALRVPVRGTESFAALLDTVRARVAEAQSHADVPFAHVVRRVSPARSQSHNPLFPFMFDVQPGGADRLRLPGVRGEALRVRDRRVSLFDLSVSVEGDSEGTRLVAEFATDLFDRATVTALLDAYRALLAALLAAPERAVGEAPLLAPDTRAALLERHERTRDSHRAAPVTELIARRLREGGAAPALIGADGTAVSYGRLDAWSAAVASALTRAGVGPGDSVALHLPRSAAAVAAILGTLRTGASYLPLDPAQPRARTEALLATAAPAAVLAEPGALQDLDTGGAVPVTLPPDTAEAPDGPVPWHPAHRDALAYTLFTSGSTGTPKGVMVTRGGLDTYVAADLDTYRLTPADRVLMFTELTFDVSAEELFPALAAGAALVPRTPRMLETPDDFFAECHRLGVTVTHLPTAWFHQLAAALDAPDGPEGSGGGTRPNGTLRAMAIGGEAPAPAVVARWRAAVPDMLLTNVYGPTETTIVATMATLAGGEGQPPNEDRIPLGEPIPGASCHVLDGNLEPVPPGAVGELYLGGAGLARGYLADPARTAASFVPHPFATGRRLYRTGDLVRRDADGGLEYRGRTDQQVKIRGYRVEPGEAEAALLALPGIAAAAVVPAPDRTGLLAYAVPSPGTSLPPPAELAGALARTVPSYLVPSAFVPLAAIPLTAHHKVDVAALPAPPARPATAPDAAPADGTERTVAEVWREVLGVPGVGRNDDFFALGGHSLLATQVISRLRRDFGTSARLPLLFERPVLADFAAAIDHAGARPGPATPALVPRAAQAAGAVAELAAGLTADEVAALLGTDGPRSHGRTERGQG